MTYEELLACKTNTPVKLADGAVGLLVRWGSDEAGIQVQGEMELRWIALGRLAPTSFDGLDEQEERTR